MEILQPIIRNNNNKLPKNHPKQSYTNNNNNQYKIPINLLIAIKAAYTKNSPKIETPTTISNKDSTKKWKTK